MDPNPPVTETIFTPGLATLDFERIQASAYVIRHNPNKAQNTQEAKC